MDYGIQIIALQEHTVHTTWHDIEASHSKCDKCIRQCCNILTLVPVFHCSSIKLLYRCTFLARCMARVPPFITKANPWNCRTSRSINCDWLFHCKSLLKECEYSIIQSVFMTKFQTDFASSVWSVCHWVADVPFHETSASGNEQGKRSVSTGWVIEQLRCPFCFILLLFPVNVVVGYQVFSKVLSRWQKLWRRWRWKKLAPVSRAVQGLTPPPPPPTPLENFWNLGLLQYISSILEQELEFLNRTQTSLNFGFFIQWQQMNNFFF